MPVLDSESQSMPRSALRYRPMASDQDRTGSTVLRQRRSRADARSTTAKNVSDDLDLEEEERRSPMRRVPSTDTRQKIAHPAYSRSGKHFHPLFWLGATALVLLLLWAAISQLINWGTNELANLRYGYPRSFQTDAFVGQGDSLQHPSHFLALNLHGNVAVIEFIAGDPGRARDFEIASVLGQNSDQDVVTVQFIDLEKNGKPEMIVDVGSAQYMMVNAQGTFRSPTPAEQQQLLRDLQQSGGGG